MTELPASVIGVKEYNVKIGTKSIPLFQNYYYNSDHYKVYAIRHENSSEYGNAYRCAYRYYHVNGSYAKIECVYLGDDTSINNTNLIDKLKNDEANFWGNDTKDHLNAYGNPVITRMFYYAGGTVNNSNGVYFRILDSSKNTWSYVLESNNNFFIIDTYIKDATRTETVRLFSNE